MHGDTEKCMHDRLPSKEMCSGSRDLLKIWEVTDNILETVQDSDIVAMETNRQSCYHTIEW